MSLAQDVEVLAALPQRSICHEVFFGEVVDLPEPPCSDSSASCFFVNDLGLREQRLEALW